MHAVPTLSYYIAPEFAQQRCKLPYAGLQPDAPTYKGDGLPRFVDSKIQSVRHVLDILVMKLKNVGV